MNIEECEKEKVSILCKLKGKELRGKADINGRDSVFIERGYIKSYSPREIGLQMFLL